MLLRTRDCDRDVLPHQHACADERCTCAPTQMLPAGLTLQVSYSAKVSPLIRRFSDPQFDFGRFEKLAPHPNIAVAPPPKETAKLSPSQKLTVFSADLRDLFRLESAGTLPR